ncbi:hypothetical protein [Nostoc flagelliforme]|nr:hypothetical protein [Nostoc flagelliforme]
MDANAECLPVSEIDERADARAAVESDRALCGTFHLSETDSNE